MRGLRELLSLAAAACALYFATGFFYQPLTTRLPTTVSEALEQLPGVGASGGFVTQILSEPSPANVRIDGVDRGTTPFFGNVVCRQDQEVEIEVSAAGWKTWRRLLKCQQGGTLQATARLER